MVWVRSFYITKEQLIDPINTFGGSVEPSRQDQIIVQIIPMTSHTFQRGVEEEEDEEE